MTTVQLKNPARDIVEEVTVVCYRDDGAGKLFKEFFQPIHRFRIKVVGGFIQQQQRWFLQQQPAQCDPAALAA